MKKSKNVNEPCSAENTSYINCVSINYKLCDETFRSLFTFSEEEREKLISSCCEKDPVLICTCNRTEIYFKGSIEDGIDMLCDMKDISGYTKSELRDMLRYKAMLYSGEGALKHLFKVCCGIESMVIGEDEILGQVKNAYAFSKERIKLSAEMNLIFQSAIAAAKKVKTQTDLSRTSVSTATLAAKQATRVCETPTVMLIGSSGKIGSILLKNLLSYKNVKVIVTTRSHKNDISFYPSSPALKIVPYEERYHYCGECDCLISATSSPHYTLTAREFGDLLSDGRKRLFIDLAVPKDIDPKLSEYENNQLIGIDHFEKLAAENNAHKTDSVEQSKEIISEELDELKKQLAFHSFMPNFKAEKLAAKTAVELFYRLKSELSFDAFEQVLNVIDDFGDE